MFMTLTLFSSLAYFNKHSVTFIKLGTNNVNVTTSWCYCFPRYNVLAVLALKKQKIVDSLV